MTAMAAWIALRVLSLFHLLGGRAAVPLIMAAGSVFALARFGMLERRLHCDG